MSKLHRTWIKLSQLITAAKLTVVVVITHLCYWLWETRHAVSGVSREPGVSVDWCVCREDSCLCHMSGLLVSEFEDDLTTISSLSDENDLSGLCQYLTAGCGKLILQLLSVTGIAVRQQVASRLSVARNYGRFSFLCTNNLQDSFLTHDAMRA